MTLAAPSAANSRTKASSVPPPRRLPNLDQHSRRRRRVAMFFSRTWRCDHAKNPARFDRVNTQRGHCHGRYQMIPTQLAIVCKNGNVSQGVAVDCEFHQCLSDSCRHASFETRKDRLSDTKNERRKSRIIIIDRRRLGQQAGGARRPKGWVSSSENTAQKAGHPRR